MSALKTFAVTFQGSVLPSKWTHTHVLHLFSKKIHSGPIELQLITRKKNVRTLSKDSLKELVGQPLKVIFFTVFL